MADKELYRPTGLEPSWANDQAINDPGESWDTTDTKVEPGAGKRDDGFLPEENPNAQHMNHLLNEIGKWVQYLSNVQHQNWHPPQLVGPASAPNLLNTSLTITRDLGGAIGGAWFVAGDLGTVHWSVDGSSWTLVNSTTQSLDWSASKDPRDAPILAGPYCSVFGTSTGNVVYDYINGVWTSRTVPGGGSEVTNCGCWGGSYGLFNAGGHDGAGNPIIWDSNPSAMNWTTVGIAKNVSQQVIDIAHDPDNGLTVAIGDLQGGNADIWTSTNGIGWTLIPNVFTSGPRCIAYNRETGLWTVICGALGEIWTSTDGTIWSLLTTSGASAKQRSLHTRGGLMLFPNSTARAIHASTDGGLTWTVQALDFDDKIGTLSGLTDMAYAEDIGVFAVTMTGGGAQPGQLRQSLSCGTVLTKTDGAGNVVFYTPTVT